VHPGLQARDDVVSIRSPIIAALSECAPIALSAERIISGFGLPTKYGSTPVAREMSAATEPVAGSGPSGVGPSRRVRGDEAGPRDDQADGAAMPSKEYVRVSPRTT
jgi:hypothetical protein